MRLLESKTRVDFGIHFFFFELMFVDLIKVLMREKSPCIYTRYKMNFVTLIIIKINVTSNKGGSIPEPEIKHQRTRRQN